MYKRQIVDSINDCHLYQYIVKPFDPEELKLTIETGIQKFDLVNNKTVILKDLRELFYKTIKLIASALDAKDPYTHGHSLRAVSYTHLDVYKRQSLMYTTKTASLPVLTAEVVAAATKLVVVFPKEQSLVSTHQAEADQ